MGVRDLWLQQFREVSPLYLSLFDLANLVSETNLARPGQFRETRPISAQKLPDLYDTPRMSTSE